MGVPQTIHEQNPVAQELRNFRTKTSLEGDSIYLVLLLEQHFTPYLINHLNLFCFSQAYHKSLAFESTYTLFLSLALFETQTGIEQTFIQVLC